jgi:branched-chain amino acid aminotransferase
MYVRTDGLRCTVSSWRRVDDNAIPARAKVAGAYVNSALAKTDAQRSGFDEAIMLTAEGHVSEGSAENIFLVKGRELITPPPSENILLGVTRDTVMRLAERELGMHTHQRIIDRTELYTMDEIILTGTACEIAPVVEVDYRPIGSGEIGPISSQIQRLYADVVRGKRSEYSEWNTPVYGEAAALPHTHAHAGSAALVAGADGHAKHTSNGHAANVHNATAHPTASSNGHASNGHGGGKSGSGEHTRTRKPRAAAGSATE